MNLGGSFNGSLFDMVIHAGFVVQLVLLLLLIFSVVSWAIILMKYFNIKKVVRENELFLSIYMRSTKLSEIFPEAKKFRHSALAEIFRAGYAELAKVAKTARGNPSGKDAPEAAGQGIKTGMHAATLSAGHVGVLHGNKTYLLQDGEGQVHDAYSIAAGLDYPGVGPEHSYFKETGRATYVSVEDQEAVKAFLLLSTCEGIIPAMESAHAVAYVMKLAPTLDRSKIIVINLSGRGDKDTGIISQITGGAGRETH